LELGVEKDRIRSKSPWRRKSGGNPVSEEIRCQFIILGRKSGVEEIRCQFIILREEIRCQFIILGKSGVSSSFLHRRGSSGP
jgi:hypothetical protein